MMIAPLTNVPRGIVADPGQGVRRFDDPARFLDQPDCGLRVFLGAARNRAALAGRGDGQVMARHAAVVHIQDSLTVINFIPGGEGILLALAGFQLLELRLFLFIDAFMLPYAVCRWRLEQPDNGAVHVALELATMVLKAELLAGVLVDGMQRDTRYQPQARRHKILAAVAILEPLKRGCVMGRARGDAKIIIQLALARMADGAHAEVIALWLQERARLDGAVHRFQGRVFIHWWQGCHTQFSQEKKRAAQ